MKPGKKAMHDAAKPRTEKLNAMRRYFGQLELPTVAD